MDVLLEHEVNILRNFHQRWTIDQLSADLSVMWFYCTQKITVFKEGNPATQSKNHDHQTQRLGE